MAALDAIFLIDQQLNAINQIGPEKLGKAALGLAKSFEKVRIETDWKNTGSKKGWKSKVDMGCLVRFDPSFQEEDRLDCPRAVEDEQRAEMEREAAIQKAKTKLATYSAEEKS
jgi:hypothetical protein